MERKRNTQLEKLLLRRKNSTLAISKSHPTPHRAVFFFFLPQIKQTINGK